MGYVILKYILQLNSYWYHKMNKNRVCVKQFSKGFICLKSFIFVCFKIFPILESIQCFRYSSCVVIFLVRYFELLMIRQLCKFDLLKSTAQLNLRNNYYSVELLKAMTGKSESSIVGHVRAVGETCSKGRGGRDKSNKIKLEEAVY